MKFVEGLFTTSLKIIWYFSVILILYSPIAMNWLYNAHRQEKIMSALESAGSQDCARENLASKTNHWAEQSVLPVFLKKSKFVDEKL